MGLRLLFAGIPAFANALADAGHTLRCVVLPWLEEDEEVWALVDRCGRAGAPVLPARAITAEASDEEAARIRGAGPYDLMVVMNFDRRVAAWARELPRHGAWNVHPSVLPRLRGYNPYFWTIFRGETETGVSVHHMTERFDDGDTLAQTRLPVPAEATAGVLHDLLHAASMPLLLPLLADLERGLKPARAPQDHRQATTAPMPRDADLTVDLREDARVCVRRIRAATPHPGARLVLRGVAYQATGALMGPAPSSPLEPGTLFRQQKQVFVAAGTGSFRPLRLTHAQDVVRLGDLMGDGP
jgi:methionyl-tRNA formyltransferase